MRLKSLFLAGFGTQSDIQPRVETCRECVSFPHTVRIRYRLIVETFGIKDQVLN